MSTEENLNLINQILINNGGLDIVTINISKKTSMADYLIVVSATSSRHAITLAEKCITELKQAGVKNIKAEGLTFGDWIAIDTNNIIIHVFKSEVREYYAIEQIWQ
ncbi:ribosome silencing factor [Rickettsiales bacterium LUAb2]